MVDAIPLEESDTGKQLALDGAEEQPQLAGRVVHQLPAHADELIPDTDPPDTSPSYTLDEDCSMPDVCKGCRWGHEDPPGGGDLCGPCDFGEVPPSNFTPRGQEETA